MPSAISGQFQPLRRPAGCAPPKDRPESSVHQRNTRLSTSFGGWPTGRIAPPIQPPAHFIQHRNTPMVSRWRLEPSKNSHPAFKFANRLVKLPKGGRMRTRRLQIYCETTAFEDPAPSSGGFFHLLLKITPVHGH